MKPVSINKPEIKFSQIRTLEGRQDKGFEELCVQLLSELCSETLLGIDRVEGRGGDGGVEAIATTETANKIGLQTKFFTNLSSTQWTQIDESVKTAIKKHPELTRYLICVPLDRTPGQLTKWAQWKAKWTSLKPDMSVEWVGFSELANHLVKPRVSHLLTYWLGCPDFSLNWLSRQTLSAIDQLHDRYTPRLHQKTSAEIELWRCTASNIAISNYRDKCSRLVIAWRKTLREISQESAKHKIIEPINRLEEAHQRMLECVHKGDLLTQQYDFVEALTELRQLAESAIDAIITANPEPNQKKEYEQRAQLYRETELTTATEITEQVKETISQYLVAEQQSILILKGQAGSGKSHLFANLARSILDEGRPCLLLIGERFASNKTLTSQITDLVDWRWSMHDLLACMSAQAAVCKRPAVLMIDAINESPERGLWRRELTSLLTLMDEFPQVKLIVSCRSDCLDSSFPRGLLTESNTITHHGFDLDFNAAVQAYFDGYKVVTQQFPTMNAEFRNPLFLKTLCEAFQGKTLPLGSLSFVQVLAEWENRISEDIERKIDCSHSTTKRAVNEIISLIGKSGAKQISAEIVESICKKHFPVYKASTSLYRFLNSEGLLQEIETPSGHQVRLQYERFSDIRIAQVCLQGVSSKPQWMELWKTDILPNLLEAKSLSLFASPQLFAYALLLPEQCDVELVESPVLFAIHEKLSYADAKETIWTAWLDSLAWRVIKPTNTKVVRFFLQWANYQPDNLDVLARLIEFSCVPAHPLNADFLHERLVSWDLPLRETTWTIPLAHENPTGNSGESVISPFIQWVESSIGKATEEQVRLAVTVLIWLTSSTNRKLRKIATDTAIRSLVGSGSGDVCLRLLDQFWDVNDPYVKERLLATMAGVVPYLDKNASTQIADYVFKKFWNREDIEPHILQREYAAFIVRYACAKGILNDNYLKKIDKGIQKKKPVVWSEEQVQQYELKTGYEWIRHSLTPEEMGHYGDFGRYEMGSAVHHFVDNDRADSETSGLGRGRGEHDARFARRYIWQRIIELGWTPELYSDFERSLRYAGRTNSEEKIERISKKYQWIGLHEYLGLLSDSLLFKNWGDDCYPLRGAWELSVKDYVPDEALVNWDAAEADPISVEDWRNLENPIVTKDTIEEKAAWVGSAFLPFEPYLSITDREQKWIVLHTHLDFDEELGFGIDQFESAQMSQWIDIRAFLIPKEKLKSKLKILQRIDFYGDGIDIPSIRQCGISEYPWHPLFAEVDESCRNNETWTRSANQSFFLPVCAISNDVKTIPLLAPSLYKEMSAVLDIPLSAPRLNTQGEVEIISDNGRTVFKGSIYKSGTFIVDKELMIRYLKASGYTLVWCVLSEKSAWDGSNHAGGIAHQSALYELREDGSIVGKHTVFKATK